MNAIETLNLRKEYKEVTAVKGLTLSVKEGEFFGLLGVNGAGKTTTVKMLTCLTSPTAGTATVGGFDLAKEEGKIKEIIAVSPQETAVAKGLTVEENLKFICGVYGFSREKSAQTVAKTAEELALTSVMKRKAGKLSGGWQRRVGIAMALITSPEILFLDEPTLGLDVLARAELWDLVKSLKGKMTVILTTHYMEEAEELCDRIGIMKEGELLCCGTAEELKERVGATRLDDAFVKIVKGEEK